VTGSLHLVPLRFREAGDLIDQYDPLFPAPQGMLFALGAVDSDGVLRGAVMVGRCVNRHLDNRWTVEVNRCASDGTRGVAGMLYAAAADAARALGCRRIVAYTVEGEKTRPLRDAGFSKIADLPGHSGWNRANRYRRDDGTAGKPHIRWEKRLGDDLPFAVQMPVVSPQEAGQLAGQLALPV
jgi:hypothetical protein